MAQAKKLSPSEWKRLLDVLRRWPDDYRKPVAALVHHAEALAAQVKTLEAEVWTLKQLTLNFEAPKPYKFEPLVPDAGNIPRMTLRQRIHKAIKNGEASSDNFRRMLRLNNMTDDVAWSIYEAVEKDLSGGKSGSDG